MKILKLVITTNLILIILLNCNRSSETINIENSKNNGIELKIDSILNYYNFNRQLNYEQISLLHNGNQFLRPGQVLEELDPTFSFRYDPNGDFWNKSHLIMDYLSLDEVFSIGLEKGSINGILFFSTEKEENQIFNIAGTWIIEVELNDEKWTEIYNQITTNLFPCLKNKLKFIDGWKYENDKKNYVEHFKVSSPNQVVYQM